MAATKLNSARQVKKRAIAALQASDIYVNREKKLLCFDPKEIIRVLEELISVRGEFDNILPQYDDTQAKTEMESLRNEVCQRIDAIHQILAQAGIRGY